MSLPLAGVLVVDFSQFLAGPYASLRLQDLGARVIKVEKPDSGDLCRSLYLSDTILDQDSTLFHAINRGKESIVLNLKTEAGRLKAQRLASKANIVLQNFRPGVIERLGLDFDTIEALNPKVVYGSVSGYGPHGPWRDLPGQDLLAQARSGLMWLSGNADDGPVPVGLPLADLLAGATLVQGVLAGLYRQATKNQSTRVETSLLECLADAQFEFLTTYLNNGHALPQRESKGSAHAYLAAPYGIYETRQGQLALAMTPLDQLADALEEPLLEPFANDPKSGFRHREDIRAIIANRLRRLDARSWENRLTEKGIWCARVLQWPELLSSETFKALDMMSDPLNAGDAQATLMRSPLRIDGVRAAAEAMGPVLNANGDAVSKEFGLD
ncbi:CaiB/BaiF CoA-transferase family protein [uncultured Litoreibacter sp.]|uniref:CaiB/BaiF CoA transferase family protein n=1 Tax=uncultured Litoreibacter sp. TaxID=1392394 RepID=UPI00262C792C|nr:CaiB/BaiF CoA-transferase family protein [uncultured Litoreibacter sp.]